MKKMWLHEQLKGSNVINTHSTSFILSVLTVLSKQCSLTVVSITHSHVLQESNVVYKIKQPGEVCHEEQLNKSN